MSIQQAIYDLVIASGTSGTTAYEIGKIISANRVTIADHLKRLAEHNQIVKIGFGRYAPKTSETWEKREQPKAIEKYPLSIRVFRNTASYDFYNHFREQATRGHASQVKITPFLTDGTLEYDSNSESFTFFPHSWRTESEGGIYAWIPTFPFGNVKRFEKEYLFDQIPELAEIIEIMSR